MNIQVSSYDKELLEQLEYEKGKLVLEEINEPHDLDMFPLSSESQYQKFLKIQDGTKTAKDKRRELNLEINRIKNKYDFSSKEEEYSDKNIININKKNTSWKLLTEKIDNYASEKKAYKVKLFDKSTNNPNYFKQSIIDMKKWEEANENILEKIEKDINSIIIKFNLQLEINEYTKSYDELIIKDLSNENIIEYDDISTGTKNLLSTFIPLKSYNPKDSIILIDEPENSFYPDIQRELTELYMNVGENNQLIMATHSPLIASSFEPWEVIELKFDKNNQIYRELYYEGENHVDNYTLDPRMLTWTSILTDIFDLKEDSNFSVREKKLMEYATLKAEIKAMATTEEKEEAFKELKKISKLLGLYN
jgi:predicted ATP-dependent endonuclease of OLD family